jgi:ribosomal protein S4
MRVDKEFLEHIATSSVVGLADTIESDREKFQEVATEHTKAYSILACYVNAFHMAVDRPDYIPDLVEPQSEVVQKLRCRLDAIQERIDLARSVLYARFTPGSKLECP